MAQDQSTREVVLLALDPLHFPMLKDAVQELVPGELHPSNPVLRPRPGEWDGTRCKVYGTVLVDPSDGLFKMWYSGGTDTPDAIRRECGAPRNAGYAWSTDGIHWHRPNQGLIEHNGSTNNNILTLDAQTPNVFLTDEPVGSETRFLMFLEGGQRTSETSVLASADGLNWKRDPREPFDAGDWSADTHEPFSVLHDPLEPDPKKRWKGYSLLHINRDGYRGRSVGYFYAADPHSWQEHPTQPIMSAFEGMESEIHIPHVTRFHDTYVMLYDAMEPNHHTQTEVAVSDDGEHFRRIQNGVKLLPNGDAGSVNAGKVCVSPRSLFTHEGKIWWYHTVSADTYQTAPRGLTGAPWYRYTNLAQWREDGFARLRSGPGSDRATITTIPLQMTSDSLGAFWLNARCGSGESITVELLDGRGTSIAKSQPWSGDHLRGEVRWTQPPRVKKGDQVSLRLSLVGRSVELYAIGVGSAQRLKSDDAPAPIIVPPDVKPAWTFQAKAKISGSPVTADGRVYVGSWDHHLYAIDSATGKQLWAYATGNAIVAAPVVYQGTVFTGSRDGFVHAVDANSGELKWKLPVHDGKKFNGYNPNGPWIDCAPVIAAFAPKWNAMVRHPETRKWMRKMEESDPSYLFIGAHDRQMHAIDPKTGNEAWRVPTFNWIVSRAAVENYLVYFGSMDGHIYALDAQCGALKWRYKAGQHLQYAPEVVPGSVVCEAVCGAPLVAGGFVYCGGDDGFLYALDAATGEERWHFQTRKWIWGQPRIFGQTIVVASSDGHVYGLDASSGAKSWCARTGNANYADVIEWRGDALIACTDGRLYLICPRSGDVKKRIFLGSPMRCAPCVGEGDVVFAATCDGRLQAIDPSGLQ